MSDKRYYSDRHGRRPQTPRLSLEDLRRAIKVYLLHVEEEGYFQEHLGHFCVDRGFSPGLISGDPETEILLTLGKANLWPMGTTIDEWSEDDSFDMVEFLYAHVSKPTERHWHDWNGCGWHCTAFDVKEGRTEFRDKLNRVLRAYDSGFELSMKGDVLASPPSGLDQLVEAPLEHPNATGVVDKVTAALHKFRRHRATVGDRREAVGNSPMFSSFFDPTSSEYSPRQTRRTFSTSRTTSAFATTALTNAPTTTSTSGSIGSSTTSWPPFTQPCD